MQKLVTKIVISVFLFTKINCEIWQRSQALRLDGNLTGVTDETVNTLDSQFGQSSWRWHNRIYVKICNETIVCDNCFQISYRKINSEGRLAWKNQELNGATGNNWIWTGWSPIWMYALSLREKSDWGFNFVCIETIVFQQAVEGSSRQIDIVGELGKPVYVSQNCSAVENYLSEDVIYCNDTFNVSIEKDLRCDVRPIGVDFCEGQSTCSSDDWSEIQCHCENNENLNSTYFGDACVGKKQKISKKIKNYLN